MSKRFYQVGGSLPPDIPSYVQRDADSKLYEYLKKGYFCYILNARQVGKSSLRIHTSIRLAQEGYICIHIDITSIGSKDISADQWYYSFTSHIIEQLFLDEIAFAQWWEEQQLLSPVRRFSKAFDSIILPHIQDKKIIIFIDEIDSILGIHTFSTDDFFAVTRSFYNLRAEKPAYRAITFAIFGVATPEDLMRDSSRTPFNIAYKVTLNPFKLEASMQLANGLTNQSIPPLEILERVFFYTNGMPYLTQKILYNIAQDPIKSLKDIDKIVDRLFIKEGTNERNLRNVEKRIVNNKKFNIKMITLLHRILHQESIKSDPADLRHIYLKLSGLISSKDGYLHYSNHIYELVFDKEWLSELYNKINRPFSEDLNRWLELNKDTSALIKGEVLAKAKTWANQREDLTPLEHRFLNASIEEELKIKNKIALAKEKKRSHLKYIRGLSVSVIVILILFFFTYQQKESAQENEKLLKQSNQQLEHVNRQLEIQKEQLEQQKKELKKRNQELIEKNNQINTVKNWIHTQKTNNPKEFLLKKIILLESIKEGNSTEYDPELTKLYIDRAILCMRDNDTNCTQNSYQRALFYKEKSQDNKFDELFAQLYSKLSTYYQDKSPQKSIDFTHKALKFYEKDFRYLDQRAALYYQLALLYLPNNKEQAEIYHDVGFSIYKDHLLPKETYRYLPRLAEHFLWLANPQISHNSQQQYRNYHKALNIYQLLNREKPSAFIQEINRVKQQLRQLPFHLPTKNKRDKKGWIYIGKMENQEWIKQLLAFRPDRYSNPNMLVSSRQISIIEINVRQTPSEKGKKFSAIHLGDSVKILKIKNYTIDGKKHIWGFVEFQ